MDILPVIEELMKSSKLKLNHSLPIVVQQEEALIFREYKKGDQMIKSELFNVYEPMEN